MVMANHATRGIKLPCGLVIGGVGAMAQHLIVLHWSRKPATLGNLGIMARYFYHGIVKGIV